MTRHPPECAIPAAHISQVPQRSPLRYPGGKTWAIPHIRHWLAALPQPVRLAEPFAGGATASLTAVAENADAHALMSDLDPDVAAFWIAVLHHPDDLIAAIRNFRPTPGKVRRIRESRPKTAADRGFRTLVINRTSRAGILTPNASQIRAGEAGKGVRSRWYPQTLIQRIEAIARLTPRLKFQAEDGLELMKSLPSQTAIFADPPYPTAGKRLYNHNAITPGQILEHLARRPNPFLLTCEWSQTVIDAAEAHGLQCLSVKTRTAHHQVKPELMIAAPPALPAAAMKTTAVQ